MVLPNPNLFIKRSLESSQYSTAGSGGLSGANVAGIVIAIVTAIAAILGLFTGWKCWRKRSRNQNRTGQDAVEIVPAPQPATNMEIDVNNDSNARTIHNTTITNNISICPHHAHTTRGQEAIPRVEDIGGLGLEERRSTL